ncbi:MAG: hypothetical protein ACI9DK_001140 [Vicingaceae bacterium]|jgi:hypothetical protein
MMNFKNIKDELQHILSGKSGNSYNAPIQAIADYLGKGNRASPMAQEKHQNKTQEAEKLKQFGIDNNWMYPNVDSQKFISSGAEQKVYIKDDHHVIKLNDAIYYASWQDYFHNLLLHNYFFADTAYRFVGFNIQENNLFAVVQQPFVEASQLTELKNVKTFLESNGFTNNRNHDYFHLELGIILEDLHDENVLTKDNLLYFIDTVFYIKPELFWT